MNIIGPNFKLTWDAPDPSFQVQNTEVFEHVGDTYDVVKTVPQPDNFAQFTGVVPGQHNYVAKFHNAAGDSPDYSNEVQVIVVALPAVVTNLALSILS